MAWGFVLVTLIFTVAVLVRVMQLSKANSENSPMARKGIYMAFMGTYVLYVVAEVIVWALHWMTFSWWLMPFVMNQIVMGLVWLMVEFHWLQVIKAWGMA